ncbi:acetoacetate decarboxylase family protein [Aminobacter aminovorans]|nr:acetoacetate decarboxylase family protein [Aminobacter aminovorans]
MRNESYVGGVMNMTGVRPGDAFKYEGPTMPNKADYWVTFTSTYEAIEKYILPPPLKADRSVPPEVRLICFVSPENKAFSGKVTPYQGFMFLAQTEHNGVKGRAGWEYVDAVYGDKSEVDIMGPWGVYFGMMKKLGDIRFTPLGGNRFQMSVDRRGVRMITLKMSIGAEMEAAKIDAINAGISGSGATITVREIPNVDYTGFTERSICVARADKNCVLSGWNVSDCSVEFGHTPEDPLDQIPVLEVTGAGATVNAGSKELFTEMYVLDSLPLDAT